MNCVYSNIDKCFGKTIVLSTCAWVGAACSGLAGTGWTPLAGRRHALRCPAKVLWTARPGPAAASRPAECKHARFGAERRGELISAIFLCLRFSCTFRSLLSAKNGPIVFLQRNGSKVVPKSFRRNSRPHRRAKLSIPIRNKRKSFFSSAVYSFLTSVFRTKLQHSQRGMGSKNYGKLLAFKTWSANFARP